MSEELQKEFEALITKANQQDVTLEYVTQQGDYLPIGVVNVEDGNLVFAS